MLSGAEPAETAGTDDLKAAHEVFKSEACDISPEYASKTVSTDGWKSTQAAWKTLFSKVVILLCFLHAWLKIRWLVRPGAGVPCSMRAWRCICTTIGVGPREIDDSSSRWRR